MHKRTYLNACLVLALAAGASQASAAPGASEMAGDVAVLQASPASTGHARFANPNAATSAAGIHFAAHNVDRLLDLLPSILPVAVSRQEDGSVEIQRKSTRK